ncbi:UNVERIFIED_CONTAM: hypothetical protein FKN15_011559 [Acipenser sinensis]
MYGSARTVGHLEGSPSRSPRLPRSPRLGHRRTNSGGGGGAGGAGKTLSMENIQSLNAAYATSGPMYLSDHEGVATTTFPKGTMTLGRATSRATYGGRVTAMGSNGTLTSAGLHHQVPSSLRQVRDNTMLDMHSQLKDLHRENELLRKELDLKDGKLGSSMNSIKTFWSPELKKERVLRKEEAARMSILKEQMRVSHEENQTQRWLSVSTGMSTFSMEVTLIVLFVLFTSNEQLCIRQIPDALNTIIYLIHIFQELFKVNYKLVQPVSICQLRKPADLQNLAPGTHPPFITFNGEVKTDVNKIEEFLEDVLSPPKNGPFHSYA